MSSPFFVAKSFILSPSVIPLNPMNRLIVYRSIRIAIAFVWLVNGLWCKLLEQVPRHEQIVDSILGYDPDLMTKVIGGLELVMVLWILSAKYVKLNVWFQVIIIVIMNVMEFAMVPDLLLWGKWNLLFAILFASIILSNEYCLRPAQT